MLEKEVLIYRQRFIEGHKAPRVFVANKDITVHNMVDSSNRLPQGNIGWINYWRAFSGDMKDFVKCSCCGESLSVHKELKPLHEAFANTLPGVCNYNYAVGGHVEIKGINGIEDGIYITPLCENCNKRFDEDIYLQPLSIMVEEIDPIVNK